MMSYAIAHNIACVDDENLRKGCFLPYISIMGSAAIQVAPPVEWFWFPFTSKKYSKNMLFSTH